MPEGNRTMELDAKYLTIGGLAAIGLYLFMRVLVACALVVNSLPA